MASLTNQTVGASYQKLLITDNNSGLSGTATNIEDGDGTASALNLSTTKVGVANANPTAVLDVTGNLAISSTSALAGNVTVGGGYGSTGVTLSDAGNIQANGTLTVDGVSTLTGAATLGSTLSVGSNATVTGNLAVTGTSSFTGAVTVNGTADTIISEKTDNTKAFVKFDRTQRVMAVGTYDTDLWDTGVTGDDQLWGRVLSRPGTGDPLYSFTAVNNTDPGTRLNIGMGSWFSGSAEIVSMGIGTTKGDIHNRIYNRDYYYSGDPDICLVDLAVKNGGIGLNCTTAVVEDNLWVNDPLGATVMLTRSSNTEASLDVATVTTDTHIGSIKFGSDDPTAGTYQVGACIKGLGDAEWGTDSDGSDCPARLEFHTASDTGNTLVNRMTVDSTGNVGIGTAAPTGNLHIVQGTATGATASAEANILVLDSTNDPCGMTILSQNGEQGNINFGDAASSTIGKFIYDHADNSMQFHVNASERMRISNSGKLGIGITGPLTDLHIKSNEPILRFSDANSSSIGDITGGIEFCHGDSTVGFSMKYGNGASASAGDIGFVQPSNDILFAVSSADSALMIKSSGNIGMGTSAPKNLLHLEWSDTSTPGNGEGILLTNSDSSISAGQLLGTIGFDSQDGNAPDNNLEASAYIAAYASQDHSHTDKGGDLAFGTAPDDQSDDTVSSERMRILQNGNIGIGTNSPVSKLHILDAAAGAVVKVESTANNIAKTIYKNTQGEWNVGVVASADKLQIDDSGTVALTVAPSSKVGIGASPPLDCALSVDGGISGKVATFNTTGTSNNVDVTNILVLRLDSSSGNITITGLTGGVAGQVVHFVKFKTEYTVFFQNDNNASTQEFHNGDNQNNSIALIGGCSYVCARDGSSLAWYQLTNINGTNWD